MCILSSTWKVRNVHTVYFVNTMRRKHLLDLDIAMKIMLNEYDVSTGLIDQARRVPSRAVQLKFRIYRIWSCS